MSQPKSISEMTPTEFLELVDKMLKSYREESVCTMQPQAWSDGHFMYYANGDIKRIEFGNEAS